MFIPTTPLRRPTVIGHRADARPSGNFMHKFSQAQRPRYQARPRSSPTSTVPTTTSNKSLSLIVLLVEESRSSVTPRS